jgi:class 3 adenylate cyclase
LDIGEWLRSLGLQSYEQMFKDNGIDLEVLPHLTAEDLKEIGVRAVGHRRKILDAIGIPPAGPAAVRAPPSAERRQLTLMFVDLVGSTDLSRRIDPEELRDIMRAYQNTVAGEIARLEGHVAKFLGDGILAYFGWPRAREDAAERAVRGGLAVAEAVGGMVAGANGHLLQARVGIATGLVVVGDLLGEGAAKEEAVTGETPNLAARVQQAAEPGTVVIADSTRRLVGDLFELVGLGALQLKGFAEPVPAWRVIGEGSAESRFEALHGAHVTPLVGRGEELELMLSRWRLAEGGSGQVVLISGEPGIGKSRLVLALRERLESEPIAPVSYACSPQHSNSPLFPFISRLEREARFAPDDSSEKRFKRLEALLSENGQNLSADAIPVFVDLLGIPGASARPAGDVSAAKESAPLSDIPDPARSTCGAWSGANCA